MTAHSLTTSASGIGAVISAIHNNGVPNLLFFAAGCGTGALAQNHAADATFAGATGTYLTNAQLDPGGEEAHLWYLLNPPATSGTAQIDLTGDVAGLLAGAFSSYGGCLSLKTANVATAIGTGTAVTVNVTTVAKDWVYACAFQPIKASTWTPGAGMNERADIVYGTGPTFTCFDAIATGTTTAMSTTASVSGQWGIIAVPFSPVLATGNQVIVMMFKQWQDLYDRIRRGLPLPEWYLRRDRPVWAAAYKLALGGVLCRLTGIE